MVVVPPGAFVMGSAPSEAGRNADESPQHEVLLAHPFAVAKFDVTRDQFAQFVAETGYDAGSSCYIFSGQDWDKAEGRSWRNPGFDQAGTHPVVCVSWNDAQAYVDWLKRKTGRDYRLLSEAEWEYAARAPTGPIPERTTWCGCGGRTIVSAYPRYFFGNDDRQMCRYANGLDVQARMRVAGMQHWPAFSCSDRFAYTSPVGTYLPNAFGLYDMLGDVWQWTQDCYTENYLEAPTDGSARFEGACQDHVRRGGSWSSVPWHLRAAMRMKDVAAGHNDSSGIRIARTIGQ